MSPKKPKHHRKRRKGRVNVSQPNGGNDLQQQNSDLRSANEKLRSDLAKTQLELESEKLKRAEAQRNIAPWNDKYTLARNSIRAVFALSFVMFFAVTVETWETSLSIKHLVYLGISLLALIGTIWGAFWYTRTLR